MNILHVVGARPNFMKITPVWRAISNTISGQQTLVHTGQHYDINMSEVFFTHLGLPKPDYYLGVGSGTHAEQTAAIMIALEKVLTELNPDLVLVYGDVNSTIAAALVSAKLMIPVGHVEAGLRSFDRSMPEEINRLLTDQIADLLFTPSKDGNENLLREGIDPRKIHFVGNVMIDTLVQLLPKARNTKVKDLSDRYALVTLHRPSNVDDLTLLKQIVSTLIEISDDIQIVFPVHPRTRKRITEFNIEFPGTNTFKLLEPLGYLDFIALLKTATVAITDSGGIQEETTYLGLPCLTVRKNTERPITISLGTNTLIGKDMSLLKQEVGRVLSGDVKKGKIPPLWDGQTSERIVNVLQRFFKNLTSN